MASGDVIEVVPGEVYRAATDFSEFAVTGPIGFVPAGITGYDLSIPAEMDSFGILEDPVEGNYFYALQNGGGNQFAAFGIDAFLALPNQDIIEGLGRFKTPLTLTSNHGWGGLGFSIIVSGTNWHKADFSDNGGADWVVNTGQKGSSAIIVATGIARQPGEWFWIRYRRARDSIGSGAANLRVKVWYGTINDEPAAWLQEQVGVTVNSGPFGDGAVGLSDTYIGEPDRVNACSFLSFTTGVSEAQLDQYPPLTPSQIQNQWGPAPNPVSTTWEECGAGESVEVAAVAATPHRYWRVYISTVNGGTYCSASDIEFRATVGGADQTGAGTAFASFFQSGNPPANAFDGNISTQWGSFNQAAPQWIAYDFGAGNEVVVVELAFRARNGFTGEAPNTFQVEYSDDNVTWSPLFSVSGETGWAAAEQRIFDTPNIIVTGLPTGYKAQVDAGAAVTETGGVAVVDISALLPASTLKILDPADAQVASVSPVGGISVGDEFLVTAVVPTPGSWEPCN